MKKIIIMMMMAMSIVSYSSKGIVAFDEEMTIDNKKESIRLRITEEDNSIEVYLVQFNDDEDRGVSLCETLTDGENLDTAIAHYKIKNIFNHHATLSYDMINDKIKRHWKHMNDKE